MDSSFNNFLNVYLRHYYHSFPLKKYCNNYTKQGWLTKGIKISCQHKRELYILYKNTNNSKIINYYKTYCKILSKVIKTAKRHHINNLIKCSKNKTKTMWNIVKTETNNQDSNDKLPLNIEGNSLKDYCELANVFNDYFINATNTHQSNDMSKNVEALNNLYAVFNKRFPQLNMAPVNAKEIKDIIRTLKWKSSSGYDEIPLKILKISAPYIISPLIYLCNKSMTTGIFPT